MQNLVTESNIPEEIRDIPFDEDTFLEIVSGISECNTLEKIERVINKIMEKEIFLHKL